MTLWCFGDSFINPTLSNSEFCWIDMIGDQLNIDDIRNFGSAGSSLPYTYTCYNEADIQANDYVIITLTDLGRQFLRPEYPGLSTNLDFRPKKMKFNIKYAIHLYFTYLYNEPLQKVYLTDFLYRLQHDAKEKNLKVIIFECFDDISFIEELHLPNLHIVPTGLVNISMNELTMEFNTFTKTAYKVFNTDEPRLNHLCLSNHKILASKVVDYLINNQPITLDNFKSNIIDESSIRNSDFHIKEFKKG